MVGRILIFFGYVFFIIIESVHEPPHRIGPMDLHTRVQPIRSTHHRTDLFVLNQMASAGLDVRQIRKVGRIGQARERGALPDVDLFRIGRASRNVSTRQRAGFCPRSSSQKGHDPIRADSYMLPADSCGVAKVCHCSIAGL
jgi:hypothetical protein